jgi:hypothetical protein
MRFITVIFLLLSSVAISLGSIEKKYPKLAKISSNATKTLSYWSTNVVFRYNTIPGLGIGVDNSGPGCQQLIATHELARFLYDPSVSTTLRLLPVGGCSRCGQISGNSLEFPMCGFATGAAWETAGGLRMRSNGLSPTIRVNTSLPTGFELKAGGTQWEWEMVDCNQPYDVATDKNHCGGCGRRCVNDGTCVNGDCQCPYYTDGYACQTLGGQFVIQSVPYPDRFLTDGSEMSMGINLVFGQVDPPGRWTFVLKPSGKYGLYGQNYGKYLSMYASSPPNFPYGLVYGSPNNLQWEAWGLTATSSGSDAWAIQSTETGLFVNINAYGQISSSTTQQPWRFIRCRHVNGSPMYNSDGNNCGICGRICKNGGTCVNGACSCALGFSGPTCS